MESLDLDFIKKRREILELTLQDMANGLGFKNASTYMKYENGTYSLKANKLPDLARILQCKIDDFFSKNIAETEIRIKSHSEQEVS